MIPEDATVPCNGCTLCCQHDVITLHPERGDVPAMYETEKLGSRLVIKRSGGNGCRYLGQSGCTIYGRRPSICRVFDCRRWYQMHSRAERRSMVANGIASKAIFDRGRALLPTLISGVAA